MKNIKFSLVSKQCAKKLNKHLMKNSSLDPNNPTFGAIKYSINIERAENLDVLGSINEH